MDEQLLLLQLGRELGAADLSGAGAAFGAVVTAFTKVIIELLAKAGGAPNFDAWKPGGLVSVGPFLTALVAFLILAFVVYFFIVKPYEAAKRRFSRSVEVDAAPDENTVLLREIRDALVRNDEGSPRH